MRCGKGLAIGGTCGASADREPVTSARPSLPPLPSGFPADSRACRRHADCHPAVTGRRPRPGAVTGRGGGSDGRKDRADRPLGGRGGGERGLTDRRGPCHVRLLTTSYRHHSTLRQVSGHLPYVFFTWKNAHKVSIIYLVIFLHFVIQCGTYLGP